MKADLKHNLYHYLILSAVLLFSLFLLPNCAHDISIDKPAELIEFRTIEPGVVILINVEEIFFAESYDLIFSPNQDIHLDYDSKENTIRLTAAEGFSGITYIEFKNNKQSYVWPIIVKEKIPFTFQVSVPEKDVNVFVMGNFNDWNRSSLPMSDDDGDGVFSRTVYLDDGIYQYQFVIGNREIYDPDNPLKTDNGFGYYNSLLQVKSPRKAGIPRLYFLPYRHDHCLRLALDSPQENINVKVTVLKDNAFYPEQFIEIANDEIIIDLQPISGDPSITTFRIVAACDNLPGNVITVWTRNGAPLSDEDGFLWHDAIIYSLMIDRFDNGNSANDAPIEHPELDWRANFQGGDFAGIIEKIESGYFNQLGVNTIWISPVNKTTNQAWREWPEPHRFYSGYHGYWPVSPDETEPRFGSMAEFKQLVETAHRHGLKILLDFVSNHVHIEHPFYEENRNWFGTYELPDGTHNIRRWDEYRLTTWFDTFLASFDFINSPEAIEAMTDNAIWWIKTTGIDGFRHDATKHVPYEFWRALTRKTKTEINPNRTLNVFQIGESFGSHELIKSYVNNAMLESQFSFDQFFTARRVFTEPNGRLSELKIAIDKAQEIYGANHLMGNTLDSHDQIRIMSLLEGDMTMSENGVERAFHEPRIEVDEQLTYQKEQVLFCYLLTVPGVPIIYYGDEFGMTGANDPDNRRMMRFGDQLTEPEKEQLKRNSKLIQLRKEYSALRRGDYLNLYAGDNVMIYSRGDAFQRLIIALNKNDRSENINLTIPNWMAGKTLASLINGKEIPIKNQTVTFTLPKFGYDVFILE